jgi:flagellar hook-length control protein FliK
MTFNAPMLPNLPPTSAAGLNSADSLRSPALKSGRQSEPTRDSQSFLATLNHVSQRQSNSPHKPASKKHTADLSAAWDKESTNSEKTCNAVGKSPNQIEEAGTTSAAEVPAIPEPWQAFALIHRRLLDFSMVADGTFSNSSPVEAGAPDGSNQVSLDSLKAHFRPHGQGSLMRWLASTGAFEPDQLDISSEAGIRYLAEQFAAKAVFNQDTGAAPGTRAEAAGLQHWPVFAPEAALNSPAAALAADADPLAAALLQMQQAAAVSAADADPPAAALLQMQQAAAATPDANVNNVGDAGQSLPADPVMLKLIEDLLIKWTTPLAADSSDLSENSKWSENAQTAGAVKDPSIPVWMAAAPDSEPLLETPLRQATEDTPELKIKADVKVPAEQSVNPNTIAEAATAKPAADGAGIQNPVLKAEIAPLAEFGDKINRIEGDDKDAGFFFTQNQMPEHLKTLEGATRSLEGARQGLAADTMSQIVQKAVLLVNNDQQEVHIELKPEFLGHIRMQIVTENQQVTIRIAAELPFVKEMLESNLNQLKAELQAQGLQIDALEVSVANDSYADGNANQKPAQSAKHMELSDAAAAVDGSQDKPRLSPNDNGGANGETAIDYFA